MARTASQKTSSRKQAKRTKTAAASTSTPTGAEKGLDAHVLKALQYAHDVVDGKIDVCRYVKAACRRQLSDLERFKDHPLYYWDEVAAGRVCRFIELLPHVKGPKAKEGSLISLEPWQCFVLTTIFGWLRKDTGGRRFRRAYLEMPRGNAKSTLSSAVGIYCAGKDGEEGAEVYSAATTRDQAKIVHGDAQAMLRKRMEFSLKLGFVVNQHIILHPQSNSKFEALSRESGTMDGKNVHLAIIDELHAHKDRGVYDVIETGCAKRNSSLLWIITTAGSDFSGICYEVRSYVVRILDGKEQDESQFGIIYTLDEMYVDEKGVKHEADDWTDPKNWVKANPNWGVSVMPDAYEQLAKKAMAISSAQNNFKTKHLNLWVNADVAWMDMRLWDRCGVIDMDLEALKKLPMVGGLDLSTKVDIASKAKLFKCRFPAFTATCPEKHEPAGLHELIRHMKEIMLGGQGSLCRQCYPHDANREDHYIVVVDHFLPEATVESAVNDSYEGWVIDGWLQAMPGQMIDFKALQHDILADSKKYDMQEFAYDPWQAAPLAQDLADNNGIPMIEVRNTVMNFSAPMKEMDALVRARRWHHNADPVMRWMVSNVVCHVDAKDNIYPKKERPECKIDGVVACIIALTRALVVEDPYSERGFRTL